MRLSILSAAGYSHKCHQQRLCSGWYMQSAMVGSNTSALSTRPLDHPAECTLLLLLCVEQLRKETVSVSVRDAHTV